MNAGADGGPAEGLPGAPASKEELHPPAFSPLLFCPAAASRCKGHLARRDFKRASGGDCLLPDAVDLDLKEASDREIPASLFAADLEVAVTVDVGDPILREARNIGASDRFGQRRRPAQCDRGGGLGEKIAR